MAKLAKEATTIRRVLESLFRYFDNGNLWSPEHGLALSVLLDMQLLMESSGIQLPCYELSYNQSSSFRVICFFRHLLILLMLWLTICDVGFDSFCRAEHTFLVVYINQAP